MIDALMLLGQATTSRPATPPPPGAGGMFRTMVPLLLAFGALYWFMFRGQRKERKQHTEMLANLKRNDRVQTIGGVLGTVVDVRDHEVVIKVDETSNVKMRFNRGAIKEVLAESADARSG